MKLPLPLMLQTRVGRRIALLFVVSALVPVIVMAIEGYSQVRNELMDLSLSRLRQGAETVGQRLMSQLIDADNALLDLASVIKANGGTLGAASSRSAREAFTSVALIDDRGVRVGWGDPPKVRLSPDALGKMGTGRSMIVFEGTEPSVWIVIGIVGGPQVWGSVDRSVLFKDVVEGSRLPGGESWVCIRSVALSRPLFCPARDVADDEIVSGRWDLFLSGRFIAEPWRISVRQALADVYQPEAQFRSTFALSMVTVLALVVLLTSLQVRRSLQPLTELSEGTRRLGRRDFSGTVSVTSGDEFEDLASSFNTMAGDIEQHFRTITATSAIDQVALASRNAPDVAVVAAHRLRDALSCVSVSVYVAGARADDPWIGVRAVEGGAAEADTVRLDGRQLVRLREAHGRSVVASGDGFDWLGPSADGVITIFPLISHDDFVGAAAVWTDVPMTDEQRQVGRQLADQLALGLANAGLIVRLKDLSYGALIALARTVEASSHWTAGHSERVTSLSLRIGAYLDLPDDEMETLHRGGLLHDIGKIGVLAEVLDFDGPLSLEQRAIIQCHPTVGATILTPIASFERAIPIVLYHHERYDGFGYPHGLAGEAIPFLARLLAVADVYDALVSDRPYRAGWELSRAIKHIRDAAGTHFDPGMALAFIRVIEAEGDHARFVLPRQASPG